MKEKRMVLYISNILILAPAIVAFIYLFPKEFPYWDDWYLVVFIIPFVKYLSPKDWRGYIYPLTVIIILLYVLISNLSTIFNTNFPFSYLFILHISATNIDTIMFTVFTSIVFLLIFEGILSDKTAKTMYYMFLSITSTIYFLSASRLASLSDITLMQAYSYTSILLLYNMYLLVFKGYEFLTLILSPSVFISDMLIATFIVSIIGLIMNLNILGTEKDSRSLEAIGYPILAGGMGAFIISFLLVHIPYGLYSLLATALIVVIFISITRRTDRKENYPIKIMEDNEIRTSGSQ